MRRTVIAVVTSCLLVVSACSSGGSSSTTPTASEADVVAWMDKVCGAVDGTVKSMSDEPPIDMNDPSTLKTGLSDWLGTKVTAVDKSIADLKALENGPHPRSKELVTAASSGMEQIKTLLSDTKSKLDSAADVNQVVAAFTEMVGKAGDLEKAGADVQKKFDETGLAGAAQKANNCKGLQTTPPTT
ncbi:hypothetical protein ACFWN2_43025 [Lentzea sp. NPDC058436]|uniref:hypothetical protein n=1 Tax=Lentzea sp. NPDC058436 TaxID=3346499 RepID=UPI00365C66EB